jgi:hypothetical protein
MADKDVVCITGHYAFEQYLQALHSSRESWELAPPP